jgi:hypothetical protein
MRVGRGRFGLSPLFFRGYVDPKTALLHESSREVRRFCFSVVLAWYQIRLNCFLTQSQQRHRDTEKSEQFSVPLWLCDTPSDRGFNNGSHGLMWLIGSREPQSQP